MKLKLAIIAIALTVSPALYADELAGMMKKVQDYAEQKNFAKAIEELGWVQKELEKGNAEKIKDFFPDELAGYKGGKAESNSVMGMTNTERSYTKGSTTANVSLSGGSAGGAMAGLAGLGKMAAMFGGGQPGMDSFRINGRTAQLNDQGDRSDLTVFLDSGSILKIEGAPASDLKAMAEALGIEKLDNYLRGQE